MFTAFKKSGGQRIIALGSCAEYSASTEPLHEETAQTSPATLYGQAKLELYRYVQELDISHAWARIFHCYGSGENPARFVPQVARALAFRTHVDCSSGQQVRDMVDVRDLGKAIAMLVKSPVEGAINLGSGEHITIGDVARRLGVIAGRPDLIRLGALEDRMGEAPVLVPDISRQKNNLGFVPRISLQTGLEAAYNYWVQERDTQQKS